MRTFSTVCRPVWTRIWVNRWNRTSCLKRWKDFYNSQKGGHQQRSKSAAVRKMCRADKRYRWGRASLRFIRASNNHNHVITGKKYPVGLWLPQRDSSRHRTALWGNRVSWRCHKRKDWLYREGRFSVLWAERVSSSQYGAGMMPRSGLNLAVIYISYYDYHQITFKYYFTL